MKKIKIICTYLICILCICITIFRKDNDNYVNNVSDLNSDKVIIYVMKNDDLIPITLKENKMKSDIENIKISFELMKKGIDFIDFQTIIPKSVQLLDVNIDNDIVKLNFNEAIYTMNTKYELRFIEAIVNSVLQFNDRYKIQFYVNNELVDLMPLSNRVMYTFDNRLGINNFKLEHNNLHSTVSKHIVNYIEDEDYSYHVIETIRVSKDMNELEFIDYNLNNVSYLLKCEKIEYNNDEMILHLNESFLYDENTIDTNKVINLLYSLKLNGYSNKFILKVNDEIKTLQGYKEQVIEINDLYLNIFEQ